MAVLITTRTTTTRRLAKTKAVNAKLALREKRAQPRPRNAAAVAASPLVALPLRLMLAAASKRCRFNAMHVKTQLG